MQLQFSELLCSAEFLCSASMLQLRIFDDHRSLMIFFSFLPSFFFLLTMSLLLPLSARGLKAGHSALDVTYPS